MTSYFLGADLGSTMAKAVVVDGSGAIRAASTVAMGAVSRKGMQRAIDEALTQAGITVDELGGTISTGYGRRLVPGAQRSVTEITCHARGTAAMCPGVRLVIDVGGQDSKAITVGQDGFVDDFAMNDRCASGTGRFYEVLARALECELDELGPLAMSGSQDLEVSSMCVTFAETEIVSLLAQGMPIEDIASSVHRAIAARTLALVAQRALLCRLRRDARGKWARRSGPGDRVPRAVASPDLGAVYLSPALELRTWSNARVPPAAWQATVSEDAGSGAEPPADQPFPGINCISV